MKAGLPIASLSTATAIFNFNQHFFTRDGDVSLAMAMRHQRWRWRFLILPSNSFLKPYRCFSNINKNLILAHNRVYKFIETFGIQKFGIHTNLISLKQWIW